MNITTTETASTIGIVLTNETTTPPPEWSPPTIAGGIEETFLLFGQPENTSGRGIGTLNDGRRITWAAYREAIRDLYGQLHTGAVTPEAFSSELHAIDAQFGFEPMEPVPDGDVEDTPPSVLGGSIAAGTLDAPSPALPRTAAGVLLTAAFILSACSPPTPPPEQPPVTEYPGITQQVEPNTPTPPPTTPPIPPTPEATATTPPQEFACWEPGEPNEVNHLVWNDTIEDQMAALVAEEKSCLDEWGITAENVRQPFLIDGKVVYNKAFEAPYRYLYMVFGKDAYMVTSVSRALMPSGNTQWVIGLAMKREGGSEPGIFHFILDRQGAEHLQGLTGKIPPEMLSDDALLAFLNSDRLQQGFRVSPFIAGPGDAVLSDQSQPWSDSIFLIKTQFIDGKGFVLDTGEAIGTGLNVWALAASLAPTHMLNSSQFNKAFLAWAETKIFPTSRFAPLRP